jgi:tetratricopeptide (TPR) repeat protein
MKAMCMTLFVCLLASAAEQAQVEGKVASTDLAGQGPLWAQLDSLHGAGIARTLVGQDGRFLFIAVTAGTYMLRITDVTGRELASQPVNVRNEDQRVTIQLPEPTAAAPVSGRSVSVAELRHKPAKKALRAAEEAQKFAHSGDHVRAVAALEKAVALDPEFVSAHGNLGAEYAVLHRYGEAAAELQRAVTLDPTAAWLQSNLAFALWQSGKPVEAEQWARRAVALSNSDVKARYLLGWVLSRRPEARAEAIEHLQFAAREFPPAHRTLAAVYMLAGEIDLAKQEAQRYLAADPGADRAEVERWISSLR